MWVRADHSIPLLSWVDVMEAEIRTRSSVGGLSTVATVNAVVALSEEYLNALGEEIDGRETHHKWFLREGECFALRSLFEAGIIAPEVRQRMCCCVVSVE